MAKRLHSPLTTGIDTVLGSAGNDYINGALSDNGRMTYQTLDSIDGGLGTDTLFVEMSSTSASVSLTPTRTSNVELFEISNVGTVNTATLNLSQVSGVEGVTVAGSSARTDVTNIGNAQVALASTGTTADVNFTILNSALSGSDTVNLSVDGHTGAIAINSTGTNDIEGLSLEATGADSTISTLTVGDSAGDTMTSMTVSGEAALTITNALNANVTSVDASATTGGVTLGMGAGDVTVLGGEGNDSFDFTTADGKVSVVGGVGNDTFVFGDADNLKVDDTITGGDGLDTLAALSAGLTAYVKPTTATITGIERLRVDDDLAGALTTSNVQVGITEVQLDGETGGNTVTFDTGVASTLRLNNVAGGTIAVASAGVATTDSITIKNVTAGTDVFNGKAITATGVETLTLDGGTVTTRVAQTVATIGATSGTTAVSFVGNNAFTLSGAVTAGSVDASGLTGTAALTMTTGQVGVTSITGSGNADTLIGRSGLATTISGGAGNDTITGGTAADSLVGGDGADSITAGGGNDSVSAGAGNDAVVTTGALTNLMMLDGGDGVDTLSINTAATVGLANTTNFETLLVAGTITQGMEVFTGSTFTRIDLDGAGATTINNASSSVATLRIDDGATNVAFARLVNTSTDMLTVGARQDEATTVDSLTVNNEDTLNIGQGAILTPGTNFVISSLNAVDVDTINITGAQDTEITIGSGTTTTGYGVGSTARAITINASSATGTVNFSGANAASVYAQTITGSSVAANTLVGGSGADSITGGNAGNSLVGGSGNDTLIGGTDADTLSGGFGADSVDGGSGTDTYQAGITTVSGASGRDGGTQDIVGVVINLGSSTLTAAAINTATSLFTSEGNTSIASNAVGYLGAAGAGLSANLDTLIGIENATGSTGTDYIVGSSGANVLSGDAGNDTINGGAGNDTINGDAGDDSIIGGTGIDAIDGGANTDTVDYSAAKKLNGDTLATTDTGITLTLNTSTAATVTVGDTDVGADTVVNVENIVGTAGKDTLTGDSAANNISGGTGDDTITGNAGNDVITLGDGVDFYNFANTLASGTAGTIAAVTASVGADTINVFVTADDAFTLDATVFGASIGTVGSAIGLGQFVSQAGTGAISGLGDLATKGAIVYDSTAKNIYFVEAGSAFTSGTTTLADLVAAADAVVIGSLGTLTGTLAAGDFIVVA